MSIVIYKFRLHYTLLERMQNYGPVRSSMDYEAIGQMKPQGTKLSRSKSQLYFVI